MKKVVPKQKQKTEPAQKGSRRHWLWLALILLITVLAYANAVDNDFIYQFDDDLYVTDNPDIKALSAGNLYRMFTTSYVGLYLPLTMLSYAIEYHFFGLDAPAFHLTNLLLHLINVWLVFLLILIYKYNIMAQVTISSYDEFEKFLGKEIGTSDYLKITQEMIDKYKRIDSFN